MYVWIDAAEYFQTNARNSRQAVAVLCLVIYIRWPQRTMATSFQSQLVRVPLFSDDNLLN